jgi:hypothetical protein
MPKQVCQTCRYWSALAVAPVGRDDEESTCLNRKSPDADNMTRGLDACDCWADGSLGAIDDPMWGRDDARAAYAKFDGVAR